MKNNTLGKMFLVFVVLFLATAIVAAVVHAEETQSTEDTQTKEIQGEALQVRYDHLQCKVTFTNTQIDLVKEYLNVDQTANKDKLTADMVALKVYLDNEDKEGFNTYIIDPLKTDFQKATQDLNSIKKDWKSHNLTNETKEAFKEGMKEAKDTYSDCVSDKEKKMGQVMEKHMKHIEERWGQVIGKMEKRNITVENVTAIQAEMNAKLDELKVLIASGNQTAIKEKMQEIRQEYLHLFARFEIAKLNGYADKLGEKANHYGLNVNEARAKLQQAADMAQPGHKYNEGEFRQVWGDIRNASSELKETAKETIKERIQERNRTESEEGEGMPPMPPIGGRN